MLTTQLGPALILGIVALEEGTHGITLVDPVCTIVINHPLVTLDIGIDQELFIDAHQPPGDPGLELAETDLIVRLGEFLQVRHYCQGYIEQLTQLLAQGLDCYHARIAEMQMGY